MDKKLTKIAKSVINLKAKNAALKKAKAEENAPSTAEVVTKAIKQAVKKVAG